MNITPNDYFTNKYVHAKVNSIVDSNRAALPKADNEIIKAGLAAKPWKQIKTDKRLEINPLIRFFYHVAHFFKSINPKYKEKFADAINLINEASQRVRDTASRVPVPESRQMEDRANKEEKLNAALGENIERLEGAIKELEDALNVRSNVRNYQLLMKLPALLKRRENLSTQHQELVKVMTSQNLSDDKMEALTSKANPIAESLLKTEDEISSIQRAFPGLDINNPEAVKDVLSKINLTSQQKMASKPEEIITDERIQEIQNRIDAIQDENILIQEEITKNIQNEGL